MRKNNIVKNIGELEMKKRTGILGGLLLLVAAVVFITLYPASTPMAQSGVTPTFTNAGHGIHTCSAAAPLDPIDGVVTAAGDQLVQITIGNFSATPVFVLSRNGNPAVQGWPICNDPLQCASAVTMPIFGSQLSCAPLVGTVDVHVFGAR